MESQTELVLNKQLFVGYVGGGQGGWKKTIILDLVTFAGPGNVDK